MTHRDTPGSHEDVSTAIFTSSRLPGDPRELLAHDRRTGRQRLSDVAVRHGQLVRVVVDEGDGLRLFDLWRSEGGMLLAREQMRSVAGAPVQIQWEWRQWDVVEHHVFVTPIHIDPCP